MKNKKQLLNKMSLLMRKPVIERVSDPEDDELDISQLSHKMEEERNFNN